MIFNKRDKRINLDENSPCVKKEAEVKRLEKENEMLRAECSFLRKMIADERKFFWESLKYDSVEEYRKVLHIQRGHKKELQKATLVEKSHYGFPAKKCD
ncbi:hypothetical protein [Streptococcus sp. NLN76]|uniref:hypothetical protein n=1 Tax=Streptococcus sp. NLN76 TaxID=2822800 RepID=UPI0018AB9CB9|nr:hypothetical protein [Streptococcus sp. NLN76]MBF8970195.1 hypothetical protein [Streptococcus sp. NLN76]